MQASNEEGSGHDGQLMAERHITRAALCRSRGKDQSLSTENSIYRSQKRDTDKKPSTVMTSHIAPDVISASHRSLHS